MSDYRMLDLFSGLGGASRAMSEDPNWKVTTVDFKERFEPDVCADVLELGPDDFGDDYDLVWASPPCDRFTVAQIGRYWDREDGILFPQDASVVNRIALVYHSLFLIDSLGPDYWFLENPRAMLRKIIGGPRATITYCQYGDDRMKPTDLWGSHPESFPYLSCNNGDNCHEPAPRGSKTGTQGLKDSETRAEVPYGLSKAVKASVENPESKNKLEAFT